MNDTRRVGRTAAGIAVVVLAGGCVPARTAVAPPGAPAAELAVATYAGTPLGPTTQPAPPPGRDAVGLDVTWAVVARVPGESLVPLDAQSSLTSSPLAGEPVLTSGRQTRLARFGADGAADQLLTRIRGDAAGMTAQVGHQVGLAGPGTTARFRCDLGDRRTGRTVVLAVTLPAAASSPTASTRKTATAAVALGTVTVGLHGFAGDAADPTPVDATESAWLDGVSLARGDRFALVVPCRFDGTPWQALVAYVEVTDPAAARGATARPASRPAVSTMPGDRLTLQSAVAALTAGGDPRPPLLYLAGATDARIAADAALVAGKPTLDRLRDEVVTAFAAAPPTEDVAGLGWAIDRATLLALAAEAEKGSLAPELSAVLVVHAGEVGRHPDAVAEIAKAVGSAGDLQARLVGENFIALEDNSPSARVRAFDWLKAAGRAPAGYEPLADARARRAAINKAIDNTGAPR